MKYKIELSIYYKQCFADFWLEIKCDHTFNVGDSIAFLSDVDDEGVEIIQIIFNPFENSTYLKLKPIEFDRGMYWYLLGELPCDDWELTYINHDKHDVWGDINEI